MEMSELFGRRLREAPAEAEMVSHRLLVRGGFVRPLAAGIYSYLPLGYRVLRRIEAVLREGMDAVGAQEMLMPILHPAELWQATGRWDSAGPVLMRVRDRSGRDYALAMTHEEVVAGLARHDVRSYRDLPRVVYHIQTKLRDEARPRGGLLRVREFRMKDAYSLHADASDHDRFYPHMLEAYRHIFSRCGLDVVRVEADTGIMGGPDSHEFMLPHPAGEDRLILCSNCDYAANVERAEFRLAEPAVQSLEKTRPVATPDCATIADVAAFVGVPTSQTLKAVFYEWERPGIEPELVFVAIRGDLEVNETKLLNLLGGGELRAATDAEIRAAGAEPGYASPVGLEVRTGEDAPGVLVVADGSVQAGSNFVAGANRPGYHLTGVRYPRDFLATHVADVALARAGLLCPRCEGTLRSDSAIELGHCFKLGTRYSESLGVTYVDADGREQPAVMGSYGIGVGRLMAAVVEVHHDDQGIIWPPTLAPLDVHLVQLGQEEDVKRATRETSALLREAGLEVLCDDRGESAGVKFNDADLIGCPVRVTVSQRSQRAGGVELKARWQRERQVVAPEALVGVIAALLEGWSSAVGGRASTSGQ